MAEDRYYSKERTRGGTRCILELLPAAEILVAFPDGGEGLLVKDPVFSLYDVRKGFPFHYVPTVASVDVPPMSTGGEADGPQSINWILHRVNASNISVAKIEFELKWDYGARYHNGGAFIANCWLLIRSCEVKSGYSVDLNFSAQTPTNANPEDQGPLARLPVTITGTVSNII